MATFLLGVVAGLRASGRRGKVMELPPFSSEGFAGAGDSCWSGFVVVRWSAGKKPASKRGGVGDPKLRFREY